MKAMIPLTVEALAVKLTAFLEIPRAIMISFIGPLGYPNSARKRIATVAEVMIFGK